MTGQNRGRRGKRLRAAFVITAAIAVLALGASAQAASIDGRSAANARAAAAGQPAGKDIVLAGVTSQQFPVFFKLSSDGKVALVDGIALSMACASGITLVWHDTFGRMPVHANGRLSASYASPTILTNGTASTLNDSVVARLGPKHSQLSGTWRLTVSFTFSDGTSDRCDSGPVSFSATS
jgi:hypothetical protein